MFALSLRADGSRLHLPLKYGQLSKRGEGGGQHAGSVVGYTIYGFKPRFLWRVTMNLRSLAFAALGKFPLHKCLDI